MRENRVLVLLISMLIAVGLGSSASANNGIQYYEFSATLSGLYVACLEETVDIQIDIYGSYHEFETPSGNYHLHDNWEEVWMFTGNNTGRTWYAKGVSPFQWNIGPGETYQFVDNITAKPLTGDGPKFKIHRNYKVTVNAIGDLVVDFYNNDGLDFSEEVQCIGKK